MTANTQNNELENASRRDFIIKGTLAGGGLMLGVGAMPDLVFAQTASQYDPNSPTKYGDAVDCLLMKYENGVATPLTEPVSTSAYRTACTII